jgi:hypothetical protein
MPRTVLLKHRLPDGSWHYDWLLARDGDHRGDGAGPLISFRVFVDIRRRSLAAFVGVRTPDHRPAYLSYEGEVSGDRGVVERVAEGVCRVDDESPTFLAGAVGWDGPMRRFEAIKSRSVWRVRLGATDIA